MARNSAFLATLFDLSFNTFVTAKLVRFLFLVGIAGCALVSLVLVAKALGDVGRSPLVGFGVLIAAPLVFLAGAVVTRIACELAIVGCRIAESTAETAERVAEISMSTKGQGAAESTR